MLTRRGLTDFESYVVTVLAGQYLCPKDYAREAADMQRAHRADTLTFDLLPARLSASSEHVPSTEPKQIQE